MDIKELEKKYEVATVFIADNAKWAAEEAVSKKRDFDIAKQALEIANKALEIAIENNDRAIENARKAGEGASKAKLACIHADTEAHEAHNLWQEFNKAHYDKEQKQAKENSLGMY